MARCLASGKDVAVTGYVTDEELAGFYASCRVAVVREGTRFRIECLIAIARAGWDLRRSAPDCEDGGAGPPQA